MIEIFDTREKLATLENEWRALEKNPILRIFQTYDWVTSACESMGISPYVMKWRQDGRKDTVICPFYLDAKGCLRFILDRHSDVCDCVYGDASTLHWAFKEVAEAIQADKRIKSVWLQKMNGDSAALNYLGVFLRGAFVYRDNAYSWVTSEKCDDFIAGQAQMKSKDKADLKAIRRKGEADTLRVLSAAAGDAFPQETIATLRAGMMAETRSAEFLPDDLLVFAERIYVANRADILVLERGGEAVALNFLLKKDRRYLSWIFLYSDPRTSSEMYVKYLTEKAREGGLTFDFGVGVYDYKIGTFRPQTALTYSLRYAKGKANAVRALVGANLRFLKDYIKSLRG